MHIVLLFYQWHELVASLLIYFSWHIVLLMRQCKRRLNDSKKSLTRGYRSHRNVQSLFLINMCTHIHKPWIVVIQYYTLYDTKQLMCAKKWRAWPLYSSTSPHATRLQELRRSAVTTRSNTPCIIHVHSYWWSSSATVLVETAVATIDSESPRHFSAHKQTRHTDLKQYSTTTFVFIQLL